MKASKRVRTTGDPIDFTRSIPPLAPGLDGALADALRAVADRRPSQVGRVSQAFGRLEDRTAAAAWLAPRFSRPPHPDRIFLANGTQSAVLMLLRTLVPPGKRLVAECLTYGVLRGLAETAGVRLDGLDIDEEGLDPAAFDRACARGDVGALYLNPTVHNPTTAMMSLERRQAVAAVARRHGAPVIEDDPLGLLFAEAPPALADVAPELVWYVSGLTKTIAQGLRVAYVLAPCPEAREAQVAPFARFSHWMAAPLMTAVATWLIADGRATAVKGEIAAENQAREAEARRLLPPGAFRSWPGSPHVWAPVSGGEARALAAELEAQGVLVRGEDEFRAERASRTPAGIRLSLSSPLDRGEVREGLARVAAVLSGSIARRTSA